MARRCKSLAALGIVGVVLKAYARGLAEFLLLQRALPSPALVHPLMHKYGCKQMAPKRLKRPANNARGTNKRLSNFVFVPPHFLPAGPQVLDLRGCSFLLSALPALANLPHMRVLGFSAEACTGVTTEQLESALLLTAVAAGSLRKLVARDVPDRDMAATVRHRVEGGLAAHGVEGVLVLVRVPDGHSDFDGDDDDVEDDEEQEEEQQEEEEEGEEDEDEGGEETEED